MSLPSLNKVITYLLTKFPGSQIRVIPDPPSPRMPWENYTAAPSEQLPYVLCGAGASPVLCTRLGSKGSMKHKFLPFFNPTAMPCWWAPIRAKLLSMATTAWVIWLCACVRYWPGHRLVNVCPLLWFCLTPPHKHLFFIITNVLSLSLDLPQPFLTFYFNPYTTTREICAIWSA